MAKLKTAHHFPAPERLHRLTPVKQVQANTELLCRQWYLNDSGKYMTPCWWVNTHVSEQSPSTFKVWEIQESGVLRLEDRENKLLLNVSIYNETPILHYHSHILHAFMYLLYSSSHILLTIMFNYNRILHLFNFTFYWNLHFLFLVLMTKIYFILHPTVLFSKFSLTPRDIAKCQVNP